MTVRPSFTKEVDALPRQAEVDAWIAQALLARCFGHGYRLPPRPAALSDDAFDAGIAARLGISLERARDLRFRLVAGGS